MSRRLDLEEHRHSLNEIREIMNSMKTLAYMETRKLARFLDAQHNVAQTIRDVAADFLSFYPQTLPRTDAAVNVYIVLGSERGFCGDINQNLLTQLDELYNAQPSTEKVVIIVGHRLYSLLEDDSRSAVFIDGPSVVEEITPVLNNITDELSVLQKKYGLLNVYGLYYTGSGELIMSKILPPFQELLQQPPRFAVPPVLNISPPDFLVELTDQYLLAALHEMFYTSLMAENHSRVVHLEGAVKHLDDTSVELTRKASALRQEEITEEIEVILLSTEQVQYGRP